MGRFSVSLVFRVTVFYVLSLLFVLCVVPWNSIVPGQSPFVVALNRMGIPGAPLIMNLLVLTAALSALNSALYVASRTLFVLAAHREAPQFLIALNARRVPARAIVFSTLVGYAGLIASILSPQVVFAFLINASGSVMLFVYLMVALAQIVSRRRLQKTHPERLRLKMWLFPWLSYAVVVAIVGILTAMALTQSLASQFYTSALSLAIVLGAYYLRRLAFRPALSSPSVASPESDGA